MDKVTISLDLTVSFDADAWNGHYDEGYPLTPANALAHVMELLESDRRGGAGVEVEHLETTDAATGEPVVEDGF